MKRTKAEIEELFHTELHWRSFIEKYLNTHSQYKYLAFEYRTIEIVPGNSPPEVPFFLQMLGKLNPIVIGSDWLKKNLTPQQFSEYVVDRMEGWI